MLHGLGPPPDHVEAGERPYWIGEETFRIVLAGLCAHGGTLTFDDGNASDAAIALPALLKAGLKASFFIPTDRIGTPGYLTENQICALFAAGMEIGSHGCAHHNWLKTNDDGVIDEVERSTARLSRLIGTPVRAVAIPFGYCDRRVLRLLRQLGIERVYSSFRGPDVPGRWLVRRDCITDGMTQDDIEAILTRSPNPRETLLTFLRIWKHAGNAALIRA